VLVIADCCWGIWMLLLEEEVEAHALRRRGWLILAIARHLGVDRKTVRDYLNGDRVPGQRARSEPLLIEPFVDYCRVRLADDVGRWGNCRAVLTQHCGNRLDTPSQTIAHAVTFVLVDERHERRGGRSSSAKKTEAALRISLARRSSATSRLSRLILACSSLLTPRPAGRHQPRLGVPSYAASQLSQHPTWWPQPRSRPTLSYNSLVPRSYLGDHPDRTLPQLRRIFRSSHTQDAIAFSTDGASGHAGRGDSSPSLEHSHPGAPQRHAQIP
jgi:hypothetical protein